MQRKTFSGLILIVLLTGILASTINIQPVKASGTIYIRSDGSIDPSDAPISTADYVNYILTGNITSDADGIVVERDNIIIDGADYAIQGSGAYKSKGIDLSGRTNVTVTNATIKNFDYGIGLYGSSNNSISGNHITANGWYGIRLFTSSNYNSIIGNNITANKWYGIYLSGSSNNSITENNITANNDYGIDLRSSSNNNITGNTFTNDGIGVTYSYQNVVVDNTVNGKPLVYVEDVANCSIGDAGQVVLVNCDSISVENLNLSNTDSGVRLWNTNNSVISGNNITANNLDSIRLYGSSNNSISGNHITANKWYGIYLSGSSNNSITENNITNNLDGIDFYKSSNNTISGNNITNNWYGIWLDSSSNNRFYHNNVNNTDQVYLTDSFNNTWDNGCEGNYWSNYNGTDLDDDGIGDTELPWEGVDNYPLMNPYWLPGDVNHDLKIDIYDVVRITAVYGSQQGDPNWNCHSDIAEPYGIINIYDVVTCTKDYRKEYTP